MHEEAEIISEQGLSKFDTYAQPVACPICGKKAKGLQEKGFDVIECKKCGFFEISDLFKENMAKTNIRSKAISSLIADVKRFSSRNSPGKLTIYELEKYIMKLLNC
jgi:hypothetical protein